MFHKYYPQLTSKEKHAVDDIISAAFKTFNKSRVPAYGDDRAERAVDALSLWVIESRSTAGKPRTTPRLRRAVRAHGSIVDQVRANTRAILRELPEYKDKVVS